MKLILVCGPFGSGTTAVAGLLARLGATGFGPYFQPPDPLTANSHELVAFRDLLRSVTSERTLTLTAAGEVTTALEHFRNRIIRQEFGAYDEKSATPIFLKHPLAALIIPQICAAFLEMSDRVVPKSTLSQHFKVLREAGLIRSERRGVELHNSLRHDDNHDRFVPLIQAIMQAHKDQTERQRRTRRKR